MADWARFTFFGGMVCLVFAIIAMFGGLLSDISATTGIVVIAAAGMAILGSILTFIGTILYLYEIATSNRDGQWKGIWIVAVFILGVIGVIAYELIARRERGFSGGSGNFQEFRRGPGGIELH